MEILRKIPGEPSTLEGFLTRTISHLNFTGIKMPGIFREIFVPNVFENKIRKPVIIMIFVS